MRIEGAELFDPRSRGCGPRERILPWYHSVIPGLVNLHSITDEPMVVLNAMHLEAGRIVYDELHEGTGSV